MAEYIEREALIDAVESTDWYHISMQGNLAHGALYDGHALYKADDIFKVLADAPTIDAVPVVRCKDCKYWQDNNGGYPHDECRWGKGETPDADDFCSYGERKDGDGNGTAQT